jgi:hypothetical protein
MVGAVVGEACDRMEEGREEVGRTCAEVAYHVDFDRAY